MDLQERAAGTVLLLVIMPLSLAGYVLIVFVGLFWKTERARQGVRAMDHFVNATLFNGYAWESVSSHAWRERNRRWAKVVIWITNRFQTDHCRRANRREQPIVDLMLHKRLHEQTIGNKRTIDVQPRDWVI